MLRITFVLLVLAFLLVGCGENAPTSSLNKKQITPAKWEPPAGEIDKVIREPKP